MSSDPGADEIVDNLAEGAETAGGAFGEEGEAVGDSLSLGLRAGQFIEHETGAGSAMGDAAFEASNQDDAHAAAVHMDDAGASLDQGHPLDAVEEGAEGLGRMAEGLWDGPSAGSE